MASTLEATPDPKQPLLLGNDEERLQVALLSRPTSPRLCGPEGTCGLSSPEKGPSDMAERDRARKKLIYAIALCLLFMIVEVVGGFLSNSLAIMTDAAHLLSDIAGFAISLFAIWMAGWEATPKHSFGYHRMEILGAFLSVQLIWSITGIIVYEAIARLLSKEARVDGRLMFITAAFGVCVNIVMLLLFEHGHSHSHGGGHSHSHGAGGHSHSHEGGEHSHSHGGEGHKHCHKEKERKNLAHEGKHHAGEAHKHEEGQPAGGKHGSAIHGVIHKPVPQLGVPVILTIDKEVQEGTSKEAKQSGASHGNGSGRRAHSHENHSHSHDHPREHANERRENGASSSNITELEYETRLPIEELLHLSDDHASDEKRLVRRHSSRPNVQPSDEQNINIRGAYLHVLGDLVQSVGVMLAGLVIWFFPEWQIVDLLCTLLFSVLVLATTVNILRDILEVLLESTPRAINAEELEGRLMKVPAVVDIHDLHIWQITMGKTLLACHIRIETDAESDDVLREVTELCERKYGIEHVTIQVEKAWPLET